jgi:hypothetical protein
MAGGMHSGHCLCGASRLTARVVKDVSDVCHCTMCRRSAGGPYLGVEVEELTFADDAPITVYRSSEWAERISCARCGGGLAWRMVDGSMANVPLAVFDPELDLPLGVEIFVDEKPNAYSFAGDRRRMTGAEVAAAFAGGEH